VLQGDAVRIGWLPAVGAIPVGQGRAAVEAGVLGRRAAGGIFEGVGGYYRRQRCGVIERQKGRVSEKKPGKYLESQYWKWRM
jgi:hypothetical protein